MEDFLKDRPVLDPKSALVLAAEPKAQPAITPPPAGAQATAPGPFGALRSAPAAPAPARTGEVPALPEVAAQHLQGEHGTKVQTVVERGRVTKILVTCSCGKVTEIACQY